MTKKQYRAPQTGVFEFQTQEVIATSPLGTLEDMNMRENEDW